MAFCSNCGHQLADGAKFCFECGAPVSVDNNNTSRKTVYDGEVHKCPNCGENVGSFVAICPSCGHEFRGASSSQSVQEFAKKLEEIKGQKNAKGKLDTKAIYEQTISLIRNFPIPNTEEDLVEFLVMSASNINSNSIFRSKTEQDKALSDAWKAKFEQAYQKSCIAMHNSPKLEKVHSLYNQTIGKIRKTKQRDTIFVLLIVLASILPFLAIPISYTSTLNQENARLDAIVAEVYEAIENEDYMLAKTKAATLVFSKDNWDYSSVEEQWDEMRTELLAIIEQAEKGSQNELPDGD